ncbi:putative N-acetylmannosamine-6-phosphate 2-epimerase [Phyllobacterium myrsinacearum]|uniref:N-acylglucosamine-6-phosphate 2-epimerase n=1 Tax=Phyllobacterium myrsinacearum TaxID=28101 RepID=A0A2S9JP10_9HYPH|nr:hypothetical protein C5750_07215 [Phyllobacterium myrsinacearum]PWV90477.1 putative N-acetylmannosamine-6-phosphate epimerase [Phyllobacterium myrsinacearum]RZV05330.1 putative N-acetylmannosamine-6-phosphate epimerase [Phyllobacterium myrsinacearum]
MNLIKTLCGGLVVSCQPMPGGPFDRIDAILSFARAAQASGAVALRIEGISNVAAVTKACQLPVIGITKRDLDTSAVRITPFLEDVEELIRSGASMVAVDATDRPRPVASKDLIAAIKGLGAIAMADISTEAEARAALDAGADIIGTTMSGYTEPGPGPTAPDLDLVRDCAALRVPLQVINDAQAAAWGEYRFGAGRGRDIVFVTVSSGIGGGVVAGGRLLRGARGLAGSLGQTLRGNGDSLLRLEALASGFGIAEAARMAGHPGDAKSVIAAANDHVPWANDILAGATSELATALVGVQAMVDPDCIVIGGGVGLAHGFIARLEQAFETLPETLVPTLVPAKLGVDAGVIGAADLLNEGH